MIVTICGSRVNHPGNVTSGTAATTATAGATGSDVAGTTAEAAGTTATATRCHIYIRARVLGSGETSIATSAA